MFISRLILNPGCKQARSDVLTPYEMHRTLMRAFPYGGGIAATGRVLWRLDKDRRRRRLVVYVQSELRPDWSVVSARHLDYFLDPKEAETPDNPSCKEVPEDKLLFEAGCMLAFRLRANPTKKVHTTLKWERKARMPKDNGTRMGLLTEEEQLDWLRRKAESAGFRVCSASVVCEDDFRRLTKGRKVHGAKLSLLSVRFDGVLQVTQPEQFLEALLSGIGPGKAFGFGLLSIAPA